MGRGKGKYDRDVTGTRRQTPTQAELETPYPELSDEARGRLKTHYRGLMSVIDERCGKALEESDAEAVARPLRGRLEEYERYERDETTVLKLLGEHREGLTPEQILELAGADIDLDRAKTVLEARAEKRDGLWFRA
jgi:hypothetical protein